MASHARGVAYAAIAAGLAAPDRPSARDDEARWQQQHLAPETRAILRRLPTPRRSGGTLGALIDDLHSNVTAG